MGDKTIILKFPNEDTKIGGDFTICRKEVLHKSYIDSIGTTIDFNGTAKKVISVKITEYEIFVELEDNNYNNLIEEYGKYISNFARDHNISIDEAIELSVCKEKRYSFSMTSK